MRKTSLPPKSIKWFLLTRVRLQWYLHKAKNFAYPPRAIVWDDRSHLRIKPSVWSQCPSIYTYHHMVEQMIGKGRISMIPTCRHWRHRSSSLLQTTMLQLKQSSDNLRYHKKDTVDSMMISGLYEKMKIFMMPNLLSVVESVFITFIGLALT